MSLKKIKSVKNSVEYLLRHYPATRDDDILLVAYLQWHTSPNLALKYTNPHEYYNDVKDAMYMRFDSISRARRKLQEDKPLYRGAVWHERHKEQLNVRSNIKDV